MEESKQESGLITQENVNAILAPAGGILLASRGSVEKATDAANKLIALKIQYGMTDEIYAKMKSHLLKVRSRFSEMKEEREPITKFFTSLSKEFTSLEAQMLSEADAPIQKALDDYAALLLKKKQDDEAAAKLILDKENEVTKLTTDCKLKLRNQFEFYANKMVKDIFEILKNTTIENYELDQEKVRAFDSLYTEEIFKEEHPALIVYYNDRSVIDEIITKCQDEIYPTYKEEYFALIRKYRASELEKFPGKLIALNAEKAAADAQAEADAKAKKLAEDAKNAEDEQERDRIKQKQIEAEDKAKKLRDEEQQRKDDEAANNLAVEKNVASEMAVKSQDAIQEIEIDHHVAVAQNFSSAASSKAVVSAPAAKQKLEVRLTNSAGILPMFQLWFESEGFELTPDELKKKLKLIFTLVDKKANDDKPVKIESTLLVYETVTKAVVR